ncbi:hypothetical protein TWF481_001684 [Arthrobotrys musiformis]|uniref:Uncharacterized protein n=1 Tax=Arthrobotrys musiformis TaxID=47236 RepID=A0AAV9VTZ7_9PEZI
MHIIKAPPPHNILSSFPKSSSVSFPKSKMPGATLPIPTPEPRRPSIWEIPLGCDWTLYPDSPTLSHTFDDVDLDDITMRGVSKAASFREQEYHPSMLVYHPYDKTEAQSYPQPFEWEMDGGRLFGDLADLSIHTPPSSNTSENTMDITASATTGSGKKNVKQFTPPGSGSSLSSSSPLSRRGGCVDKSSRVSRRQALAAYRTQRRHTTLLSSPSLYRTSLLFTPTATSTGTPSSTSVSSIHPNALPPRRNSISSKWNTDLLLSHMGACFTSYRMDSHSSELQNEVSGIPISAFIHPKMHIPGGSEYGPAREDSGYGDAYPLRHTREWCFDRAKLVDGLGGLAIGGIEWDSVIEGAA